MELRGLRRYWRRRRYQRLTDPSGRRRGIRTDLVGPTRKRRFWRIKLKTKLGFLRMGSPKKLAVWLRDAYVNMMMGFANSRVFSTGYGGSVAGDGIGGFVRGPLKGYDEKMIVQIYKSLLMAQDHLVEQDARKPVSEAVYRR